MKKPSARAKFLAVVLLHGLLLTALPSRLTAQTTNAPNAAAPRPNTTNNPIARIREEGLNHSQVMKTLSYLTDVIGPRLTGSPNLRRANDWTRDTLTSWGLTNAHLEAWGPFGRGWSLQRFSAQVIEPQAIPLIAAPKAWTPGFDKPITAPVIHLDAKTEAELEKYQGLLKGAIVLSGSAREVKPRFEPLASREGESNLLRLANAGPVDARTLFPGRGGGTNAAGTNVARADGPGRRGGGAAGGLSSGRVRAFALKEEAALVITPSGSGDGGTLFVAEAALPSEPPRDTNAPARAPRAALSVWSTNAPAMPAQITVAVEDYNRLVRMIQQGEKLKMAVDLQVKYHTADLMAYNTLAEIPGGDLKNELVMIGAHLDSWHSGTGATDNGAGVAATMEAVRILKALDLKPRRTIRIGLWTGEEQGIFGSKAYVTKHFGYYTNATNVAGASRSPRDESNASRRTTRAGVTNSSARKLVRGPEHEKLSAYFNLDNGTGKIRGVYMQGNEAVRPLFRKWLQPFNDLGAETLTYRNTGGTDHLSFDAVGLPGFQFIQDPIDYETRTHHSNEDVFDRIQADDLKQAATIMAAFLWNAATMDEKLPRKSGE